MMLRVCDDAAEQAAWHRLLRRRSRRPARHPPHPVGEACGSHCRVAAITRTSIRCRSMVASKGSRKTMIWMVALALQTAPADIRRRLPPRRTSHRVLMEDSTIGPAGRGRTHKASDAEPVHDHGWPSVMYFQQPQPITYIAYELVEADARWSTERVECASVEVSQTMRRAPKGLHARTDGRWAPFVAIRSTSSRRKDRCGPIAWAPQLAPLITPAYRRLRLLDPTCPSESPPGSLPAGL